MNPKASLVLHNAVVHTVGMANSVGAIAIHNGRIVAIGKDAEACDSVQRIDLEGRCVVPGFHDAHAHTARFGMGLRQVDLSSATSLEEAYDLVAERADQVGNGSWLIGHSYDHIAMGGHPERNRLDAIAPEHLVWLKHRTEHMGVANSRLLDLAGVEAATQIEGGRVDLDDDGRANGLLVETAQTFVNDLIVPVETSELVGAIASAHEHYLTEGVTTCQEAGVGGGWIGLSPDEALAYVEAHDKGMLSVRTVLMPSFEAMVPQGKDNILTLPDHLPTDFKSAMLRWGAVKIFADGALTARTAAVTSDYSNDPGNVGLLQSDPQVLRDRIMAVHRSGWQVATHAIGDRAIDVTLGAYRDAIAERPDSDPRFRIEHCAVVRPDQAKLLAKLHVIPVMQNFFVEALGDTVLDNLGPDRAAWCYRLRSLLDLGIKVANSSDRPVADGNPIQALHRMIDRTTAKGKPFTPHEEIGFLQALEVATLHPARAARMENEVGTLVPGMRADLAVLDDDPSTLTHKSIAEVAVIATMVDGEFRFDKNNLFS